MKPLYFLVLNWVRALVLLLMRIYVWDKKKPMKFSAAFHCSEEQIRDVKGYNRSVSTVFIVLSIPFWPIGLIARFYPAVSLGVFCLFATVGIGGYIWWFGKLEEKYVIK